MPNDDHAAQDARQRGFSNQVVEALQAIALRKTELVKLRADMRNLGDEGQKRAFHASYLQPAVQDYIAEVGRVTKVMEDEADEDGGDGPLVRLSSWLRSYIAGWWSPRPDNNFDYEEPGLRDQQPLMPAADKKAL